VRLRRLRGIGERTIAEIREAVVAWGGEGFGAAAPADPALLALAMHRARLGAALRALGARDILVLLTEVCRQHVEACEQRLKRKLPRWRRRRYEIALDYYGRCAAHFERCIDDSLVLPLRDSREHDELA